MSFTIGIKAIAITSHLSVEELRHRYDTAPNNHERARWHALLLLSESELRTRGEVARIVQRGPSWLTHTIALSNTHSPDGLADRCPGRSHPPFLLNEIQRFALDLRLQSPPDDEGKWTSQKVADWIEATLGHPVHVTTGWKYLRRLTYTVQQPRPRHPKAASAEQQEVYERKFRRSSTT